MSEEITALVRAAGNGDSQALQSLFAAVYAEIKLLARRQLAVRRQPTLDTTALVHETFLKLVEPHGLRLRDRSHFFAVAAKAMRQIAIDHARHHATTKRGGDVVFVPAEEGESVADAFDPDTLTRLDVALTQLQTIDPRLAELVELRFFAGLSVEQIADLREVATRTVVRDWRRARAYLYDAVGMDGS